MADLKGLPSKYLDAIAELYPYDDEVIAALCYRELFYLSVPNKTGVWPKYGVRVYYDDGSMGSGYLMVHWDDSSKVPGCLSNGYVSKGIPHDEIEWDDQPRREHLESVRSTLWEWV